MPTFRLNVSVVIRVKLKKCEHKTAIYSYALLRIHVIGGQRWEETTVLDHGRGQDLLVKEALHIQMTPSEEHFN